MPEFVDITGHKYGRLYAQRHVGRVAHGKHAWLCLCDCGNKVEVTSNALRRGTTKSCGCLMRETSAENMRKVGATTGAMNGRLSAKHGHTRYQGAGRSPTYKSWQAMKDRCDCPSNAGFSSHGAKGVAVCERWRDFRNFLADMGERPEGTSLDRINPFGNYEPENCRWATPEVQHQNTRRNWLKGEQLERGAWSVWH